MHTFSKKDMKEGYGYRTTRGLWYTWTEWSGGCYSSTLKHNEEGSHVDLVIDHDGNVVFKRAKVIIINGHKVPAPERSPLKENQKYFMPTLIPSHHCIQGSWCNGKSMEERLALGIVHSTREAAILHSRALLSYTRSDEK